MKCCVVGCGPAGIIAAKHLKQAGIQFDVFELTDDIGGTWVYNEKLTDSFGSPVRTAIYKNLRSNLPKDIMEFEGLKYDMEESFIKSSDVYQYLKRFVDKHNLRANIKLGHLVSNISYQQTNWQITVKNLKNNTEKVYQYSAVMLCNGHYYEPHIPVIKGQNQFEGLQMHSKNHRIPDNYKGKNVLVIGFSFSGQDIADDISKMAKTVYLSHHASNFKAEYFRNNIIPKSDVECLNRNSVTFKDGSSEQIDVVLYCTGYWYSFPFLDKSCEIIVDNNYVTPLYKQMININHPSMAIFGIPSKTFIFPLLEVQVKAFIKVLLGKATLPKDEDMIAELRLFEKQMVENGIPKRKYHEMLNVRDYIHQITSTVDLENLPEVLYKILDFNLQIRRESLVKYRHYNYKIIDNNNFTVQPVDNKEF